MSKDMNDLQPALRQAASTLVEKLTELGIKVKIIQTYRTVEDQAKKYRCTRNISAINVKRKALIAKGRPDLAELLMSVGPQSRPSWLPKGHLTKAGPGESKHHKMELVPGEIFSYAFDIACYDENGKYITDGNADEYQTAGKLGMELGLDWLGKPTSRFKEAAHFQAKGLPYTKARILLVRG